MKTGVTMAVVARAAGVHQTTVSLALRGDSRIPAPTRARIVTEAERLGYRPNPLVSALHATRNRRKPGRYATIGIVTTDSEDVGGPRTLRYSRDLFDGARVRADELGYGIEQFWLADPKLTKARFHQMTRTRDIHGLIISPFFRPQETLDLEWDRFSVVAYGYSMASPAVHRVVPDLYHSAVDLFQRCRRAGFRRVGLALEVKADQEADHLCLAALLTDQYLNPYENPVPPLFLERWREAGFLEWFDRTRPEVVVGSVNHIHLAKPWLEGRGLVIGRDVQLLAFGAHPNDIYRELAGVWLDRGHLGARMIDFLVAMMHRNEKGIPHRAQHVFIQTAWHDAPSFVPRVP